MTKNKLVVYDEYAALGHCEAISVVVKYFKYVIIERRRIQENFALNFL